MPTLTKGAKGVFVKRMQHFLAYAGQMSPDQHGQLRRRLRLGHRGRAQPLPRHRRQATERHLRWLHLELVHGHRRRRPDAGEGRHRRPTWPACSGCSSANGFMDPANQANFDGQFGSGTEGALKNFQSAKGLDRRRYLRPEVLDGASHGLMRGPRSDLRWDRSSDRCRHRSDAGAPGVPT